MMTAVSNVGETYIVTYNADTKLVTIESSLLTATNLLFGTGTGSSTSIASLIGFAAVDVGPLPSHTGTIGTTCLGPDIYYVCVDTRTAGGIENGIMGMSPYFLASQRIIGKVPIDHTNTVTQYVNGKKENYLECIYDEYPNDIEIIFELSYDDGTLVNLNGANWSITIGTWGDLIS